MLFGSPIETIGEASSPIIKKTHLGWRVCVVLNDINSGIEHDVLPSDAL